MNFPNIKEIWFTFLLFLVYFLIVFGGLWNENRQIKKKKKKTKRINTNFRSTGNRNQEEETLAITSDKMKSKGKNQSPKAQLPTLQA